MAFDRIRKTIFVILATDGGMDPLSELYERSSFLALVNAPISEGIDPVSLFLDKMIDPLDKKYGNYEVRYKKSVGQGTEYKRQQTYGDSSSW